LADTYDPAEMYGSNYGYRSGLNSSMVKHLAHRIESICASTNLQSGDVVIDIGSNDGTSLSFYSSELVRIGIDPTADKFSSHYPKGAMPISTFFSSAGALTASRGKKAMVVSAFSMMYDLENPTAFVREIAEVLDTTGLFVFEQSYLPLMLERVAFDTICHEHIEYYGIRQIDWLLQAANLEIVDIELNDVNGGSFAVSAAHSGTRTISSSVQAFREQESELWQQGNAPFERFERKTLRAIAALKRFIDTELENGKTFGALGASTKGNVLLQAAGIGPSLLKVVGDVNPDKYGCVTPGSWIPIVSEEEALEQYFDYYVVLPWHFKEFFVSSPKYKGRTLVFPLPELEVVLV
jgi:NDP-4-keto-2,6-dideoxyhexose 3-C-methyltransferase